MKQATPPEREMQGFVETLTAIRERLALANDHPHAGSMLDREEKYAQELVRFLRLIQRLRQSIATC